MSRPVPLAAAPPPPDVHFPEELFESLAVSPDLPDDFGAAPPPPMPRSMPPVQRMRLEAAGLPFLSSEEQMDFARRFSQQLAEGSLQADAAMVGDKARSFAAVFRRRKEEEDGEESHLVDFVFSALDLWRKVNLAMDVFHAVRKAWERARQLLASRRITPGQLLRHPSLAIGLAGDMVREVMLPLAVGIFSAGVNFIVGGVVLSLAKIAVRRVLHFIKQQVKSWILRMVATSFLNVVPFAGTAVWIAVNVAATIASFAIGAYAAVKAIERESIALGTKMYEMGLTYSPKLPKADVSPLIPPQVEMSRAEAYAFLHGLEPGREGVSGEALSAYRGQRRFSALRARYSKGGAAVFAEPALRLRYPSLRNRALWIDAFHSFVFTLRERAFSGPGGLFSDVSRRRVRYIVHDAAERLTGQAVKAGPGEILFDSGHGEESAADTKRRLERLQRAETADAALEAALLAKREKAAGFNSETQQTALTDAQQETYRNTMLTREEAEAALRKLGPEYAGYLDEKPQEADVAIKWNLVSDREASSAERDAKLGSSRDIHFSVGSFSVLVRRLGRMENITDLSLYPGVDPSLWSPDGKSILCSPHRGFIMPDGRRFTEEIDRSIASLRKRAADIKDSLHWYTSDKHRSQAMNLVAKLDTEASELSRRRERLGGSGGGWDILDVELEMMKFSTARIVEQNRLITLAFTES